LSRKVVRKVLRSKATEFHYERGTQPLPKIGLLLANEAKAVRERLTLIRLFEELCGLGYDGGYVPPRGHALRENSPKLPRDRHHRGYNPMAPVSVHRT
jgi:hypothetical protein